MKDIVYSAEPDPAFATAVSWRVRAWDSTSCPWTICQGMTEEEARACEAALQGTSGAAPVDELARRKVRSTSVRIVDQPDGAVEVSGAPFVPYSDADVADVAEVARMVLAKQLAPSPRMVEPMARALLTLAEKASEP